MKTTKIHLTKSIPNQPPTYQPRTLFRPPRTMGLWPLLWRSGRGDILPFRTHNRSPRTRFGNIVVLLACTVFTAAVSLTNLGLR